MTAESIQPIQPVQPANPSGTVTLVFTDIEGSTSLLQTLGDRYPAVLADHHRLIREAFAKHGALERGSAGDGLYFVFQAAGSAVQAAVDGQLAVAAWPWPDNARVRDRMGLHTGEPVQATEGYIGLDVHRAARICAAGHGGQILVSQTTHDLVAGQLHAPMGLIDLGAHRLRSLEGPAQRLYQVSGPGLEADFPPPRTSEAPRNNLRLEVTSFIGREREIGLAAGILEHASLLTLTGPGGVGKTRLGLRLARTVLDQFDDGVWIVECGALSDPAIVLTSVAGVLGLAEQRGRPLQSTIVEHLKGKRLLLVLDDCDPVLSACAELAEALVRTCPLVRVVVTSREALGVPGESIMPIASLATPESGSNARPRRARGDRCLPALRRAGPGGPAGVRADPGERPGRRPAVPPARRRPAGDRARRRPRPGPAGRADRGPPRRSLPSPDRRQPGGRSPATRPSGRRSTGASTS